MTGEEAVKVLNALWKYENCGFSEKKIREALDMAIKSIEIIEELFERTQIITDGIIDGRAYSYKCGLEDGKRKAQEQEIYNNFKIMSKLQETNDMEKEFKDCKIMLLPKEKILVDIAKSLAIIADEFCEMKKAGCIFDVYKNEKNTERKEIKEEIKEEIEMLMMLKKQARYNDTNTLIEDVRLSSFNFVIDKVIKSLEAESEEKNEATK